MKKTLFPLALGLFVTISGNLFAANVEIKPMSTRIVGKCVTPSIAERNQGPESFRQNPDGFGRIEFNDVSLTIPDDKPLKESILQAFISQAAEKYMGPEALNACNFSILGLIKNGTNYGDEKRGYDQNFTYRDYVNTHGFTEHLGNLSLLIKAEKIPGRQTKPARSAK